MKEPDFEEREKRRKKKSWADFLQALRRGKTAKRQVLRSAPGKKRKTRRRMAKESRRRNRR